MDRDQFFSNLFDENSEQAAASREQKQLSFEERVIKRVFRECGIKINSWGRFANDCRDVTGQLGLNFRWFNSSFKFPATLCGKRIYTGRSGTKLYELTIRDLLKPPEKNRVLKIVSRILHDQGISDDDFFVFVFPVVGTMFCAHNLSVEGTPGTRLSFQLPNDLIYIEATATLFSAVGAEWWESQQMG